jgi:hypothetical protein
MAIRIKKSETSRAQPRSMPAEATRSLFLVAGGFGIGALVVLFGFVFLLGIGAVGHDPASTPAQMAAAPATPGAAPRPAPQSAPAETTGQAPTGPAPRTPAQNSPKPPDSKSGP